MTSPEWFAEEPLKKFDTIKRKILLEGGEILDLSMINPDLPPPRYVIDKLLEASVKLFNHRYSVARGVRKTREAFAAKYQKEFGVSVDPEREVSVTFGTKDALIQILSSVLSPGDTILVGKPTYPAYKFAAQFARLRLAFFDIGADADKMLASITEQLERERPRALLINFPNNPTGISVESGFLREVCSASAKYGTLVINDFAYGEMGFNRRPPSLLGSTSNRRGCIEIYSLSKAYNIPGWRIGAVIGDESVVYKVSKLKSHIDYGVFLPLQIAAAAALTSPSNLVEPTVRSYQKRGALVTAGLRKLGWSVEEPRAGASVWAALPESLRGDSYDYAISLLQEKKIAVSPGFLFGEEFTRSIRFALVVPEERLRLLLEKLEFGIDEDSNDQRKSA